MYFLVKHIIVLLKTLIYIYMYIFIYIIFFTVYVQYNIYIARQWQVKLGKGQSQFRNLNEQTKLY